MSTASLLVLGLVPLIAYVVVGIRLMQLCQASGVSHGWLAFVPLLNFTRWARLAGKNPWLVLLWFVFIIPGLILSLIWLNKISENTGTKSPWFWVYLLATILVYGGSGNFSESGAFLIASLVLTAATVVAQWKIFDASKVQRTPTATV